MSEGIAADGLIPRLFEAFNNRDLKTALSMLHEDVVFEPISGALLNSGRPYVGHEGMRLYFEHISEHWQELQVNPFQIRSAGAAVVALGQTSGQGAGGRLDAAPTTWVFKFRDGLVSQIQIFSDERLARRALAGNEDPEAAKDSRRPPREAGPLSPRS
jgi:ketosteroid isomerase-like protein